MTGQNIFPPVRPSARERVVHFFSPSGSTFTVLFCEGGIRPEIGAPLVYTEGAQTYLTKGAIPLMHMSNDPKGLLPLKQLPPTSATISKKGMIATSTGKTIEIWAAPFN